MSNLETRLKRLEAARRVSGCPHPWHSEHVVWIGHGDDTPPTCPSCGSEPVNIILITRREAEGVNP